MVIKLQAVLNRERDFRLSEVALAVIHISCELVEKQRTLVSPGNANVYAKQFNMDRWPTNALQLGEMAQYAMYVKCRAPGLVSRQRD